MNVRVRLRFQPGSRLLRPADFKKAYASGRRFNHEFFSLNVTANSLQQPRLGLSVAARVISTAVERNRFKRLVRDSFRCTQHALPAVDIVIAPRPAARAAAAKALRTALAQQWVRIGGATWHA